MLKSLQVGYKARETRYPVLVPARMRAGSAWFDVVIHNLSAHGALIACDDAPDRGAYVDIRRGRQSIVGRVIWRKGRFFGVRAQDTIDIGAITNEPRLTSRPNGAGSTAVSQDRRTRVRLSADADIANQLEKSRRRSSAIQFCVFLAVGLSFAVYAATEVYEVLSRPFAAVEERL